jgi:branched-chain amino acid aminotransferase
MIISQNGNLIRECDATVSIFDIAVGRGIAAFEFLRTYLGKPFQLEQHIHKLFKAAHLLSLDVPLEANKLYEHVLSLIPQDQESQIKLLLLGKDEIARLLPTRKANLFVIINKLEALQKKPLTLMTTPASRLLPQIKSTSYAAALVALQEARASGYDDILYTNESSILEASTSNIFFVKGEEIITPSEGVLEGVTRGVILKEFNVTCRPIKQDELASFDEAFLTSSVREIVPIYKINNIWFPKEGRVTQNIISAYLSLCLGGPSPSSIESSAYEGLQTSGKKIAMQVL